MQFYATPKEEYLEHNGFKYTHKEWKNGRWKYYYDYNGKSYEKISGDPNSKYGTYKHRSETNTNVISSDVKVVRDEKSLHNTKTSYKLSGGGTHSPKGYIDESVKISYGKLQQAVDAGKSFLNRLFKKKTKVVSNTTYTKRYR